MINFQEKAEGKKYVLYDEKMEKKIDPRFQIYHHGQGLAKEANVTLTFYLKEEVNLKAEDEKAEEGREKLSRDK